MLDLVVIGAGLTGLTAAYIAAKAGLRVKIIAKGLGALHWSAGSVDVLGYYPDAGSPVQRPLATVSALAEDQPEHPYALLGANELAQALEEFSALAREAGLPYGSAHAGASSSPPSGDNLWLPSPIGAARPTFLAPDAQLAGDLDRGEPMLVVGFRGMRDLFPGLVAANLVKQGHRARAALLPLDAVADRPYTSPVLLAQELDKPSRRTRLAAELKRLAEPGERIGLPALLGFHEHRAVMDEVQAVAGAAIFEIPTLPPSVPGIRLNAALRREVERLGVQLEVNMAVVGFHAEGGRVQWVETETSGRSLKHRAESFLLASGGILGGGINTDRHGRAWDTVLNLPLAVPQEREAWLRPRFLDPAGHPIFHGGLPVSRQFQPVDAGGAPVYANLYAAGSILAHADSIRERSMEGIAIATGTAAVRRLIAGRRPSADGGVRVAADR